jgi:hypothetical protein
MSLTSSRSLLLLAWATLALTLQVSGGFYRPAGLVLVCVAGILMVWAAAKARGAEEGEAPGGLAPVLLAIMLGASLLHPPGDAIAADWFLPAWRAGLAAVGLALAVVLLRPGREIPFRILLAVGILVGLATRVALIVAAPAPEIDVFPMFQESAAHLLDGLNPYTTPVTDAYGGARDYGYAVFGYAYPPLNLYLHTIAYALTHDVRYASLAAEIVEVFALLRLGAGTRRGASAALLFLAFPRGPFVVEQAWTEPFIVGAYALTTLLAVRRPGSRWLALVYGLMLGLKQYLVYFILHGLMLERRPGRIALAALAVIAPTLPFLVADPKAFLDYAVLFQLNTPFRPDGLTLPAGLYALTGITIGKGLAAGVGFVVALVTGWLFRRQGARGWVTATTLTTYALFLFGSQAFANYYYLAAAMLLVAYACPTSEAAADTKTAADRSAAAGLA